MITNKSNQKMKKSNKQRKLENRELITKDIKALRNDLKKKFRGEEGQSKMVRRITAVKSLDRFTEATHKENFKYALGLLSPKDKLCVRIPSPMPIPTATITFRGSAAIPTNILGNALFALKPYGSKVLYWANESTLTDISSPASFFTSLNSTFDSPITGLNAVSFRVVSAWFGAYDTSSLNLRAGMITTTTVPANQIEVGTGINIDGLRDSYWAVTKPLSQCTDYVGSFYFPKDPNDINFKSAGGGSISAVGFQPIIYVSGATPSANISLEFIINYEYLPSFASAETVEIATSNIGDPNNALSIIGHAVNAKKQEGGMPFHGYSKNVANLISSAFNIPNIVNTAKGLMKASAIIV